MAWNIEFEDAAEKELKKLDRSTAKRIIHFLQTRVATSDDPRLLAKPLQGHQFKNLWRFRVGDYRIIAQIVDMTVTITILRIGHRKNVYRG